MEVIKAEKELPGEMEDLKIKYGGGNEIEANTYINSLLHFTTVVQAVNKSINKNKKVSVKVKANSQGSFIVELGVQSANIVDGIKQMFSPENVSYASDLITVVVAVYGAAKFLKGKQPKSLIELPEGGVRIENNEGNVNVYDLRGAQIFLTNPEVKNAVEQEFETLEEDPNVTDLEFRNKQDQTILHIAREEFYEISSSGSEKISLPNEKELFVEAHLNISSMDWEFKKKWDFYFEGHKISAKMNDVDFKESINKGERFGKGDTLLVHMTIGQQFDKEVNTFVNKSYTITKILKHIDRPAQGSIGFPE
jgi:hypothetical protein